jgi:serine/threonine protein kinase
MGAETEPPKLAGYQVGKLLAEGGMGRVYLAVQTSTGRTCALKWLQPILAASEVRHRLAAEARFATSVDSDHVVEVLDAGLDPVSGSPWMAMELLRGETLENAVAREGPLPPEHLLTVLRQAGHGIDAAHRAGIIHRDLKPANLFLCLPRRGDVPYTVKVLDFGIARAMNANTVASSPAGTLPWMAPEQVLGQAISFATDTWALGLITFFLLTGKSYWSFAEDMNAALPAHFSEVIGGTRRSASERATECGREALLPTGFDGWFAHCTARAPAERFQRVPEALEVLEKLWPAQTMNSWMGVGRWSLVHQQIGSSSNSNREDGTFNAHVLDRTLMPGRTTISAPAPAPKWDPTYVAPKKAQ